MKLWGYGPSTPTTNCVADNPPKEEPAKYKYERFIIVPSITYSGEPQYSLQEYTFNGYGFSYWEIAHNIDKEVLKAAIEHLGGNSK